MLILNYIQGLVHFPFLRTRSSEHSFSVEQEAPAQCPDQEHVAVVEESVVVFVVKVVVGFPEPPDRPKFFARAAIKLSPIDRSVVKLVTSSCLEHSCGYLVAMLVIIRLSASPHDVLNARMKCPRFLIPAV